MGNKSNPPSYAELIGFSASHGKQDRVMEFTDTEVSYNVNGIRKSISLDDVNTFMKVCIEINPEISPDLFCEFMVRQQR